MAKPYSYSTVAPHLRGFVRCARSRTSKNTGDWVWAVMNGNTMLANGAEGSQEMAFHACYQAVYACRGYWTFSIKTPRGLKR